MQKFPPTIYISDDSDPRSTYSMHGKIESRGTLQRGASRRGRLLWSSVEDAWKWIYVLIRALANRFTGPGTTGGVAVATAQAVLFQTLISGETSLTGVTVEGQPVT